MRLSLLHSEQRPEKIFKIPLRIAVFFKRSSSSRNKNLNINKNFIKNNKFVKRIVLLLKLRYDFLLGTRTKTTRIIVFKTIRIEKTSRRKIVIDRTTKSREKCVTREENRTSSVLWREDEETIGTFVFSKKNTWKSFWPKRKNESSKICNFEI